MSSIRITSWIAVVGAGLGLAACQGVVAPGSTAGNTWGARSPFAEEAPKKEEKKEPKKEEKAKAPPAAPGPHDRPGFVTRLEKGRVWVFRKGSKDLASYLKGGEPAKSVTLVGAGPEGMSLRGPDIETLEAYAASRPGYEVWFKDERYLVFKSGTMDALWYAGGGDEPSKTATLVGEGPNGRTVRAPDMDTAQGYLAAPTY